MSRLSVACAVVFAFLTMFSGGRAEAQRHSLGAAPPTAPVAPPPPVSTPKGAAAVTPAARPSIAPPHLSAAAAPGPIAAVSTGMGAIQFAASGNAVPAPQTLVRQLSAEDERARLGALSSLGAPGEYLTRGRVPFPHSVQLDLVQLSRSSELDALLTIELDQHVLSAVLVPEGESWRRLATLSFASSFSAGATTPASFVRPLRSFLDPERYRAVYHATVNGPNGDFTENEADIRVLNGRATVVMSFVSGARQCDTTGQLRPPHQTCELLQRWLEPDGTDPGHHLTLITGVGHISAHEADDPLSRSRNYRLTRLRSFACQPFAFSDATARFEPTANSSPCAVHEPGTGAPQHPAAEHQAGGGDHGSGEHAAAEHGASEHGGSEHGAADHP